jgi:hypothetical protein
VRKQKRNDKDRMLEEYEMIMEAKREQKRKEEEELQEMRAMNRYKASMNPEPNPQKEEDDSSSTDNEVVQVAPKQPMVTQPVVKISQNKKKKN